MHTMLHLFQILKELIINSPELSRKALFKKISAFPLQILEISILMKNYADKFVPGKPFLEDSECWTEITLISRECLGVLQEILN
jgi:hypothetical protein